MKPYFDTNHLAYAAQHKRLIPLVW